MKKSILAACAVAALCVNIAFANAPSQDKPVTKTTTTATTVKKSTPMKAKTTTHTVHKKHMKQS